MRISDVEIRHVLETREYFSDVDIWPKRPRHVDPRGWLGNFVDAEDRIMASQLLESYLLISTEQVEKMISSAFHGLSTRCGDMFANGPEYEDAWNAFRASVAITFPSRRTDPAGSGHLIARFARELVPESSTQIYEPAELVDTLSGVSDPTTIIFVDDFAGTGDQFLGTWLRQYPVNRGGTSSFDQLAAEGRIHKTFFIPAIATAKSRSNIREQAPTVEVLPAHLLPPPYSAAEPLTRLVPAPLRDQLHDFLVKYAPRAGYSPEHVYGYRETGLALSFEHATPDNTLPLFNGGPNRPPTWRPLRRK